MSISPPGLWEGNRPSFRSPQIDDDQWVMGLAQGQIGATTLRAAIAVATAEMLGFFLSPELGGELDRMKDRAAQEARQAGIKVLRSYAPRWKLVPAIWMGEKLPKYDEVDFFLKHPKTAPLLGKRLHIAIDKYLEYSTHPWVPSELTFVVGEGVPVMKTAREIAHGPQRTLQAPPQVQPSALNLLKPGFLVKEMTQRDMVRSVIPATGEPITNQEIRETVAREFGDRAPTARQIAQTIVGLRRDGELVQVSHGVQQATDLLGHPRIPSDPTRARARS